MSNCTACHATIPQGARFCPECGAPSAGPARTELYAEETHLESSSSRPPSGATDHGRFEPGHRIGDRYRIVGLLGKGGMGEVYRADDLELGQSVALKFLPDRLVADPAELDRFRREVRVARGLAHPNVCRTYDIASLDGHVFLVMEYVDGEDLASVLRRMGRPSPDKGLEIARQLCLGMGAAHEAGILHRDLKPANIMIDGRGRVRITDFGLAGLVDELAAENVVAGTPAYMAPEQLSDGRVSTASDVYSLGLILYEVFTGQRVFETHNLQELKRLHSESNLSSPSSIVHDLDPVVERVLMRCLEVDPARRPQSTYGVLAALPGGDPLAAALAAGETPSPALVADAGERGTVAPRLAIPVMLATVALLLVVSFLSGKSLESLKRSPSQLAVLAEQRYESLVGGEFPEYRAGGFLRDLPDSLDLLPEYQDALLYWSKWSPRSLESNEFHAESLFSDQLLELRTGDVGMVLNMVGQLRGFRRVAADSMLTVTDPDPDLVFSTMGLDAANYARQADPLRPGGYTWHRISGSGPERIRAQFRGGSLTELSVREKPFDTSTLYSEAPTGSGMPLPVVLFFIVAPLLLAGILTWRNLKVGRGDRRGANVFAAIVFTAYMLESVFDHSFESSSLSVQLARLFGGSPIGHALYHAFFVWLGYMAIEPYLRRVRPTALVSWARLVARRWQDPILGRDVLAGLFLAALLLGVWSGLDGILYSVTGHLAPGQVVGESALATLEGGTGALAAVCYAVAFAAPALMMMLVIYLLLVLVLRRSAWALAAILVMAIVMPFVNRGEMPAWYSISGGLCAAAVFIVAVFRFGVLAGVMVAFTVLLRDMPWALDPAAWYGPVALIAPVLLSLLAAWAAKVAVGERASLHSILGE